RRQSRRRRFKKLLTRSPVGERIELSLHNQRFGLSNRQKMAKARKRPSFDAGAFIWLASSMVGGARRSQGLPVLAFAHRF
ncbi:hypothetical protein, partial [Xanthomonas phaseoli]|uniref:hypothetical protein n=1 Tax=Xanthomonas phaseoli TaxID=1985254 RepID=UPI001ED959AB